MQFTKGSKHILRSVSVTDKGEMGLKASEPSMKPFIESAKFDDGVEVEALESAGGGEWWCKFPGIDAPVRTHPNKQLGSASAVKYVSNRGVARSSGSKGTNGHSTDPVAEYQAAKAGLALAQERMKAAVAKLEDIQRTVEKAREEAELAALVAEENASQDLAAQS